MATQTMSMGAVREEAQASWVPMIAWANVGHGGYFQTFPVGVAAELDADAKILRLLDPPLLPAGAVTGDQRTATSAAASA